MGVRETGFNQGFLPWFLALVSNVMEFEADVFVEETNEIASKSIATEPIFTRTERNSE